SMVTVLTPNRVNCSPANSKIRSLISKSSLIQGQNYGNF
ncbi:MAG: hypothetical protein ACI9O5_002751, partial [Algoriphagus sp.]